MTNKKSTKRALLMSVLAMLLCVTMLVGTTFAWFTDSVTSTGNVIATGTLELDLELLDAEKNEWSSIRDNPAPIFTYGNWEPGYTDVKILKVENEGSLALKWKAVFSAENDLGILADVIDVYVNPYGVLEDASNVAYPANLDDYKRVGTIREFVETIGESTYGNLLKGEAAYLGIALKMQESAGNEYQNKIFADGTFDIIVVATQLTNESDSFGDQYDKDAKFLLPITNANEMADALANGGDYAVKKDVATDSALNVAQGTDVEMSLGNNTVTANNILNNGTLEVKGGGVDVNYFENAGDATLNDVKLDSGTASDYGFISLPGSTSVLNNVEFVSGGGAIAAVYGAEVTVNSGSFKIDSTSTSGRYLIYTEGAGAKVVVNGGTYSWDAADNQKRAYVYAGADTTVIINGGTFGAASNRSGYTAGILGTGTVIITGGTFGFNPSNWVADGYEAVQNGSTWTVSAIA